MRLTATMVALMSLLTLVIPADCEAVERTAYVFQWDDDILVSLPLPDPGTGIVTPTVVGGFNLITAGSTLHPDGRILTIDIVAEELIAVAPSAGGVEVLCALSVDARPFDDLFWGVNGSLMYYRPNGGLADLFQIDPGTCSLTLEATIGGSFDTIEHHQGQYFAGSGGGFWRIDPQTFEATLIKDYSGGYGGCSVWGLASVGENLWRGMSCWGGAGNTLSSIDVVDPITGQGDVYVHLPPFSYEDCSALEVIEQPSPAEIPVLQPIGLVLLVLSFIVVGVLMSLRR